MNTNFVQSSQTETNTIYCLKKVKVKQTNETFSPTAVISDDFKSMLPLNNKLQYM